MFPTPPTSRKTVPIRVEFQKGEFYCGAACASMLLDKLGPNKLSQKDLYDQSHDFESADDPADWYSTPDGLEFTLNNNLPRDFDDSFKLYKNSGQNDIARRMAWTISQFTLPCIASVMEDSHWIIVYGFKYRGNEPTSSSDTDLDILGLYIHDPWRANAQGFIDYSTWKANYASPVVGGNWHGKYLAICDPKKKSKKTRKNIFSEGTNTNFQKSELKQSLKKDILFSKGLVSNPENTIPLVDVSSPTMSTTKNPVNGEVIIDKQSAGKYAQWVLSTNKFYNSEMLKMTIPNLIPGESVLIEYIGKDDYYYIVPMINNRKIYSLMCITANKVHFREGSFAMEQQKPIKFKPLTFRRIKNLLTKNNYLNDRNIGKIKIHGSLVWKVCSQSLSPLMPFHLVTVGREKVYIRIDGIIFPKLTGHAKGF